MLMCYFYVYHFHCSSPFLNVKMDLTNHFNNNNR